ncbi:MAG: NHL repeat-containing protein [Gammaproteobacteria bacterium]|nr:NHL repeat-containing protein [Gammaproteobacteria bacterium]MDH3449758.1 NHL repeat-containing protein [Gammaproteobacteria bacterium]
MRHSLAILLAVFLLLPATRVLASACNPGPPTGATAPVSTHLRGYPWTFHAPTRMALGVASSLLISDPERGRVVTRDASGRITGSHTVAGKPVGIAVDGQGRIYLGDSDLGRVSVYSQNWESLYELGIGAGEFRLPAAIAVHPDDGRVYVVDSETHQLRVFNGDGSAAFSFGGPGDGAGLFRFPAGIFLDAPAGELFVVDQLNFQVQVFDLQGVYLRCIGGTNASPGSVFGRNRPLNQPQGIWVDASGRVLISDAADGQVKVFDRNGNALATIGAFGIGPGSLRIPMDLVVDEHRRLFVASANNARLEVFGLDDYQDPEAIVPAVLAIEPGVLDRDAPADSLEVTVELPGYRLDAIMPGTLMVNGVPPVSVEAGDADRDRIPDLLGRFDAAALLQTLPLSGDGLLDASAMLNNGFRLEGQARVVVRTSDVDPDRDGVDDPFDLCPGTAAGDLPDIDGCSVVQLCPCAGGAEKAWRNHGHYLVCVIRSAIRIGKLHDLPRRQLRKLVPAPAPRSCGRQQHQVKQPWQHGKVKKQREYR